MRLGKVKPAGKKRPKVEKMDKMYPLWPDEHGILNLPDGKGARATRAPTRLPGGRSGSSSPRWRQLSLRLPTARRRLPSWRLYVSWRSRSWEPGCCIQRRDQATWRIWLARLVDGAQYGCVTLAELFEAARRDLGLADDDIRALLLESTAAGGGFVSDGEVVRCAMVEQAG